MKARLNLTIDERLLLDVKKIAAKNGTSLSELVTDYFKKISRPVKKNSIIDYVEKLEKPLITVDTDLLEFYYKEQGHKYGF